MALPFTRLLVHVLFFFIILASLNVMFVQPQQHKEEQEARPCLKTRSVYSTIWGAILTIAALALDTWGDSVVMGSALEILPRFKNTVFLFLQPLLRPCLNLDRVLKSFRFSKLLERRGNLLGNASLKEQVKILISCKVQIHMPLDMDMNEVQNSVLRPYIEEVEIYVKDLREALQWPSSPWNSQEGGIQPHKVWELKDIVKVACLELPGVVPHLEELKKLRTNSGITTLIAAVQAGGYFAGIIERLSQRLEISPIEGIAFIISIIVLLQAAFYWGVTSSCQRPLIINLNQQQAHQLFSIANILEFKQEDDKLNHDKSKVLGPVFMLLVVVVCGLTIGYGVHLMVLEPRCVRCSLTSLLFLLSILTTTCCTLFDKNENLGVALLTLSSILCMSSYVVGMVSSILEWDDRFNVEGEDIIQWIIPHFS